MDRHTVHTDRAPKAIGPYSQAIRAGEMIFCSGQIPIDPSTGEIIPGDIAAQTRQVLNNLREVLKAAGAEFRHVVKTTIFLKDLNDFQTVNQVYATYFNSSFPARVTVEVSRLPKDAAVEIDAIAKVD